MIASIRIKEQEYQFNLKIGTNISIPLVFNGAQPNTYNVPIAKSEVYRDGQFVGDVREGGSCNFETYTLTPHCNGTHTECIGHILPERYAVNEMLKDSLSLAILVSVQTKKGIECSEVYSQEFSEDDLIISKSELEKALANFDTSLLKDAALIIRTLENSKEKKEQDYMLKNPAFFSNDCIKFIYDLGVRHLLTDLPSLDRLFDSGVLSNHHIFWNLNKSKTKEIEEKNLHKTITEMIFVDDSISDGIYLVNIQIAPFQSDASPSRIMLFPKIS